MLSWTRLLSVAAVCLVVAAVPGKRVWSSLVLSIGFGHYAVALWYSRGQLARVAAQGRGWIPFLLLVAAGASLYLARFPLIAYFAVHHVFNEVYVNDRAQNAEGVVASRGLRASSVVLNLAIYVAILRNEISMTPIDPRLAFGFLGVAVVFYAVFVFRGRYGMSLPRLVDRSLFEVIGLGMVAASLLVEISFLQIVLYHFVFWILYPIPRLRERGTSALLRYVGSTIVVTALFLAFSPLGWNTEAVWSSNYYAVFVLLSYAHITISFAVSDAQPGWIRRVFKPELASS